MLRPDGRCGTDHRTSLPSRRGPTTRAGTPTGWVEYAASWARGPGVRGRTGLLRRPLSAVSSVPIVGPLVKTLEVAVKLIEAHQYERIGDRRAGLGVVLIGPHRGWREHDVLRGVPSAARPARRQRVRTAPDAHGPVVLQAQPQVAHASPGVSPQGHRSGRAAPGCGIIDRPVRISVFHPRTTTTGRQA